VVETVAGLAHPAKDVASGNGNSALEVGDPFENYAPRVALPTFGSGFPAPRGRRGQAPPPQPSLRYQAAAPFPSGAST
jgi:hypothetical protein